MSDFEQVYSLLFVCLIFFSLFLIVYESINFFQKNQELTLNYNLLYYESLNYSKIVYSSPSINEIEGVTISLPYLLIQNNSYEIRRVIGFE